MLKKGVIIWAFIWTIFIVYMCLKTPGVEPQLFPHIDKVVHFTFYFVFVILWFKSLTSRNRNSKKNAILLFACSILFGIIMEICQYYFTRSRMAEALDVAANTIGSVVGFAFAIYFFKIKETP